MMNGIWMSTIHILHVKRVSSISEKTVIYIMYVNEEHISYMLVDGVNILHIQVTDDGKSIR